MQTMGEEGIGEVEEGGGRRGGRRGGRERGKGEGEGEGRRRRGRERGEGKGKDEKKNLTMQHCETLELVYDVLHFPSTAQRS